MYDEPRFLSGGDSCLVVEFSDAVDLAANVKLNALRCSLEARRVPGVRELLPTYRSLAVLFDPLKTKRARIEAAVRELLDAASAETSSARHVVVMPVRYGGDYGPDMENVCAHTGLSEDEVIRRHTARDCYCYMLGFTPGFPYLGGMDEALETPRLTVPRVLIPAGSVGIAGRQTGAYSVDSPGGWQLIGRTPLRLFDPAASRPTLVEAGEWVRFRAVDDAEYDDIASRVKSGRYEPDRLTEGGVAI